MEGNTSAFYHCTVRPSLVLPTVLYLSNCSTKKHIGPSLDVVTFMTERQSKAGRQWLPCVQGNEQQGTHLTGNLTFEEVRVICRCSSVKFV